MGSRAAEMGLASRKRERSGSEEVDARAGGFLTSPTRERGGSEEAGARALTRTFAEPQVRRPMAVAGRRIWTAGEAGPTVPFWPGRHPAARGVAQLG